MLDNLINVKDFENADVMVGFKMTNSEREDLQKLADKNNTTVSKLVRAVMVRVCANELKDDEA